MIIGRPNSERELQDQEYLTTKIQPTLSAMTMKLLETKPADPIPTMISVLNAMAIEDDIKIKMQKQFMNPQLNDKQLEEFDLLEREKNELLK